MARTPSALDEAATARSLPDAARWNHTSGEDPSAVLDADGCIVDANAAWTEVVGNGPAPAAPATAAALLPSCATSTPSGSAVADAAADALADVLGGSRRRVELEYSCTCSLDERRFLLQILGRGEHALVRHVDLSARRARDEHLADLPTVHAATGLPSRASIGHQLAAALELTPPEARPVLIEVHLRALAEIAEQHGRLVADEVAVLAAARLRRTVRVDDVVGAYDDGTLVVLCPTADDDQLDAVVQRVGRTMSRPILVGARTLDTRVEVRVDRSTRTARDDATVTAPPGDGPGSGAAGSGATGSVPAVANLVGAADGRRTLQRVLEHASDVVMLFDGDGTITWVSPAARRVFRIAPEQLLGRNGMDLVHPDDRDRAAETFMSITGLGDQVRAEFRILAGDGSVMWVEEVVTNLLEDRDVGAVFANLRDITERKQAESSIEFQARLLDSVGQALVAIDDDRRVRYWNDAAARMYGFDPEFAIGRNVDEVVRPADGWQDRYAELVRHVDHGARWSGELRLRHSDGHTVPGIVTMTPVFDARRRQIASIAVASDISDQLRSNELSARLSTVVESSQDAIISTTLKGTITTWNRAATELFARSAEEMIGRNSRELAPVELHDQIDMLTDLLSAGHALHDTEMRFVRADGTPLQLSLSVAPILDDAGTPIGASISARDLSERIRLQHQMAEDHARLVEAQQITHLGSYEYDPSTDEISRSEECDRIYGIAPGALDVNLLDFVHPDDVEETLRATELALEGGDSVERTIRILRTDGALRWIRCRSALVERGGRTLLAGTMLDVTEQHLAELALAQQATHDSLTGLPNRIGLHAHLTRLLASDSTQRVAVAILDLDRFKIINDTLGHRVGDETLRAVADRLRDELGPDDLIARLGGDEFVLVRGDLPDDLDAARRLATDALAALEAPIVVGGRRFDLSGSIGVTLSAPVDSAESLLSDADAAMYLAKQRGGRNVSVFDEAARERSNRHTEVESALRGAVGRDEMTMHYQPIVDVVDGRVRGFEALARWQHPRLGAVGPDEFVPIAEASGAIVPLGRWGVHTVLEQIATWCGADEPTDDLWVAINLSSAQLGEEGFVDWFDHELRTSGVPADRVHLEITERVLIEHIEQAVDTIAALRELGVQISIDDFGTGYSSLSYLDQLPVDVLKVDRSFVDRLGPTARDTAVVRSIVALARTLELQVVVEGVETEEQRAIVAELGCELGQGYLWSRPLPPDGALEYLRAHR
jgi:diguanylate cyclase (GGDEF)-like protein/PAS domain S-box-containing protein